MTDAREPLRWLDEPSDLPRELIAGMRAYASEGPSAAEHVELRARLAKQLERGAVQDRAARTLTPPRKLLALLGLTAGLGMVMWRVAVSAPSVPTQPVALSRTAHVRHAAPDHPAQQLEPPKLQATSAQERPAPSVHVQGRPRASAAPTGRRAQTVRDPAAELELLRRARRALSSAPERALELTEEHAHSHPDGVFVQERELLAIEALVRAGQREAAAARASGFRRQFPRSAHLERMRILLDLE